MVAYDPLYLVDLSHDYLTPAMNKFNEQYQNRLRPYVVREELDQEILSKIPDNQFGMCLAYNYFNFRPFEILKKYLAEIYQKLKPGGILAFTFNDCDRPSAVMLVENYYGCYTPGYLVQELAISMGYEIVYSWNDPGPVTWLELKKPGELTSLKGGQTLAKIVPK
jgi:SAM-dependent methyltransferase